MGNLASVVDELLAVDRRELPSATVAGMGVGQWTLHPAGQEIVQTALQALSKPVPGDDRSPAQRRADALTPGAPGADYAFGATTSAEGARRFACDAAVSRIVIGPASEIFDAGRTRTFTAAQTRAILARDRHCIWDGCDAPPGWCDACPTLDSSWRRAYGSVRPRLR